KTRSPVSRHQWTRKIEEKKAMESPARVTQALGQFYLGLERIGLEEAERWKLTSKVAMDSCPALRADVVRRCVDGVSEMEEMRAKFGCSIDTVERTVEELEIYGMVKREGRRVMLKNGAQQEMERYFT